MQEDSQPTIVHAGDRLKDAHSQTAGMVREMPFSTDELWVGVVTTAAGEMSAWHHHGDHRTYAYVASGMKRIEYGPGGGQSIVAGPGDFIHSSEGPGASRGKPEQPGVTFDRVQDRKRSCNGEGPGSP
jgi:uncharacterized RmlC-like cupin family protein